jgi:hypothetical protein
MIHINLRASKGDLPMKLCCIVIVRYKVGTIGIVLKITIINFALRCVCVKKVTYSRFLMTAFQGNFDSLYLAVDSGTM